jgi:hypothetical protein
MVVNGPFSRPDLGSGTSRRRTLAQTWNCSVAPHVAQVLAVGAKRLPKVLAVRRVTENNGKKTLVSTKKFGTHRKGRHRPFMHSSVEPINLSLCDVFTYRNRTAERCARSEFPL